MYIEDHYLDDIKSRIDLVSLISQYVELKPSGKGFRGLCPFHDEKTPSFHVSPEKGIFHCFGCGIGGNLFNFIMKIENRSFPEAVSFLAEKSGVNLPSGKKRDSREQQAKNRYIEMNRAVLRSYQWCLEHSASREAVQARTYLLEKRGLTLDTIRQFGIGFSPFQGKESIQSLLKDGFSGPEIMQGGIGLLRQRRELVDRFRGRIIFAIHDSAGTPVGFAGRSLSDTGPKYLNTSDHRFFTKGHYLYGLHAARPAIRKTGQVVLVEGYMDFLALFQAGVPNAVASMGTALTRDQAGLLKRFTQEVVICYDSDNAGKAAASRGLGMLREKGLRVRIFILPASHDPDSFVKEKGAREFEEQVVQAKNAFDYTLELLIDRYGSNQWDEKVQVVRGIMPFIQACEDAVERSLSIRQAAQSIGVPESLFYENLRGFTSSPIRRSLLTESQKSCEPGNIKAEKMLLRAAIESDTLRPLVIDGLSPNDLVKPDHQRIYQAVRTLASSGTVSLTSLIDLFSGEDSICSVIAGLCSQDEGALCRDAETVNELLACIKRVALDIEIKRLHQELSRTQDIEVLRQLEQLIRQENELKNQKRGEGVL